MFTGIVQGRGRVRRLIRHAHVLTYTIEMPAKLKKGLVLGASVSVDGVCQTVTRVQSSGRFARVTFDAIGETLKRSTLGELRIGQRVNLERAARFDSEIGGHLLSGHVIGKARVVKFRQDLAGDSVMSLSCSRELSRFLFSKGFVALDGVSLTLGKVSASGFQVHLIPETLNRTTLGERMRGDSVNLEIDIQTQAIVETVERIFARKRAQAKLFSKRRLKQK